MKSQQNRIELVTKPGKYGGGGGCGTDGTRYKSLNQGSSIHSLTQNTEYLLFTQTQERQGSQKGS